MSRILQAVTVLGTLFMLVLIAVAPVAASSDWPRFRGPNGDGISHERGLLTTWPESGPEVLFRVPLGKGFSAISAVDGRLYTLFSRQSDEFLAALDAATGKEIWRLRTDDERPDGFGDGPRSTPYIEGERLYAASAFGKLYAVDRESGEVLWKRDLRQDFDAQVPSWGVSASPLIVGEVLIFNVGGKRGHAVMGFDKKTGEVLWHSGSGLPGYSNPLLFEVGGQSLVMIFGGEELLVLKPEDGDIVWRAPWKTSYDVNAAAPVSISPNRIFVSSGYDVGGAVYEFSPGEGGVKAEEVWRSRRIKNQFSSSVYHQGAIFGFDNKNLKCIDAASGEDRWRQGGFGHGSLLLADGHLIVLGDSGELALVEARCDEYVQKASAQPLEGKHWTVPTLYRGILYIRNEEELIALRVTPKDAQGRGGSR